MDNPQLMTWWTVCAWCWVGWLTGLARAYDRRRTIHWGVQAIIVAILLVATVAGPFLWR